MDQRSFYQSNQPLYLVSGGAETVSTNQTHPGEQTISPAVSSHSHGRTPIRKSNPLSCNLCRRRKVKCDKADPCSYCVRSGVVCVSSAPSGAPRGRNGGRRKTDHELLDRITKLENLVKEFEGGNNGATAAGLAMAERKRTVSDESGTRALEARPASDSPKAPKDRLDHYIAGSVWINISEEIHGMRDVLNQSSDDEEDDTELTPSSNSPSVNQTGRSNYVIQSPEILSNMGNVLQHPTRSQVHSLYSTFSTNVEPVVKLLHGPSLRRYLIEDSGKLDCSPGRRGWDALKFAIYYAATTSLTPDECLQKLGEEKDLLLHRYRSGTELALARADFVNTEEMSTLQAFVLYLFVVRSNENSRRTWTLISLAVRIAHALGLHRERCGGKYIWPHQPFDREMRRRLWWLICVLDRQGCDDRGSDPIIVQKSFSTQFPLNINDEDLIPDDPREVQPREGFTDITLSLVCSEVFDVEIRLNYVPAGESYSSDGKTDDPWAQRRGWVIACQRHIEDKYTRYCDVTVPIQRYTKLVVDIMIANLWLCTYRPLQRHPDFPTSVVTPHPGILHLSVEVMEKALQIPLDTCSHPFRWVSIIWVQWHALAVMIAELCVQTEGPIVERAWLILDAVFEETARSVADSEKGRLWRPIKKLRNKAQAVRENYLKNAAATSGSWPPANPPRLTNKMVLWPSAQSSNVEAMETESEPKLTTDPSGLVQPLQESGISTEPMSINWDRWITANPSDQMGYKNELDQMAWTSWENFIDDFQTNGDFPSGQEDATLSSSNMW